MVVAVGESSLQKFGQRIDHSRHGALTNSSHQTRLFPILGTVCFFNRGSDDSQKKQRKNNRDANHRGAPNLVALSSPEAAAIKHRARLPSNHQSGPPVHFLARVFG